MTYLSKQLRDIAGQLINGTVEDGAVECGLLCAAADEIDRLDAENRKLRADVSRSSYHCD